MIAPSFAFDRCAANFIQALAILGVLSGLAALAPAQPIQKITGDYAGTIGTQDATLHLISNPDGSLRATLDAV